MKFIRAHYRILTDLNGENILKNLEYVARTAYKSEHKIKEGSAERLIKRIVQDYGHESVIEHESVSVKVVCDRGISHEIVRHRLASYTQESTRYCNYTKNIFNNEMSFIIPYWFEEEVKNKLEAGEFKEISDIENSEIKNKTAFIYWWSSMQRSEYLYNELIKKEGWAPQQARSILPNSLKTEIVMTANLREWRHFFKLRTSLSSHEQMREIIVPMLEEFKNKIPIIFDDL